MSRENHPDDAMRTVCARFGATFAGCDMSLKVGISRNVGEGVRPIHGIRLEPEGDTCGWYIWAGEFRDDLDFFVPLHAAHLHQWAPLVVPYLGLARGWRFLITETYEDVWLDPQPPF
ncbi:immunity protein Imm33 domain-containing protein [Paraburkholderia tropica]|uniref:immunity protein Imm33 domain-containing protein n=1 Tax=Paraburkholderia tropica TaxID=92647 RepID=UPI001CC48438|nr:hypothetical protein [Paraburkholderia tropica]